MSLCGLNVRDKYVLWKRSRFCPPLDVLIGDKSKDLRGHLNGCPECEVGRKFKDVEFPSCPRPKYKDVGDNIRHGDIVILDNRLSGWGPRYKYFRPPLVYILKPSFSDSWIVAPIHEFEEFSWKDDIILPNGFGFVELWNSFPILQKYIVGLVSNANEESCLPVTDKEDCIWKEQIQSFRRGEAEIAYIIQQRGNDVCY